MGLINFIFTSYRLLREKFDVKKTLVSIQKSLLEPGVEFQLEILYVIIPVIK